MVLTVMMMRFLNVYGGGETRSVLMHFFSPVKKAQWAMRVGKWWKEDGGDWEAMRDVLDDDMSSLWSRSSSVSWGF